ncbi:MAG: hypothetical protein ABWX96_11610 [Propionibacteriaceae bacterium]
MSDQPSAAARPTDAHPDESRDRLHRWGGRVVLVVVAILVAVLFYYIAAAFIPRWWSQRVGRQVDGRITLGVTWGLLYGAIFTMLPLLVVAQIRRPQFGWKIKIGLIVLALVLAAPNIMTLGIVLGLSRAAQAGDRVLDVQAPFFRGASLAGAIIGAVLAAGLILLFTLLRHRGEELEELRADLRRRQLEDDERLRRAPVAPPVPEASVSEPEPPR